MEKDRIIEILQLDNTNLKKSIAIHETKFERLSLQLTEKRAEIDDLVNKFNILYREKAVLFEVIEHLDSALQIMNKQEMKIVCNSEQEAQQISDSVLQEVEKALSLLKNVTPVNKIS